MAPTAAHPPRSPRLVPAVARAVRLLDHIAQAHRPQTLADLSRALELPKSTLHGLLNTLAALDLLRADGHSFTLGPHVLHWAGNYALNSELIAVFHQQAEAVPAIGVETLMLAILDGTEVVYIACRPGNRPIAVNFRVGGRFPASCTATGKTLLSTLPPERVRPLLANGGMPRMTAKSPSSLDALMQQLDQVRKAGYAIDDEETAQGMHCFGAPVFIAGHEEAVAGVATSVIKAAVGTHRIREIIDGIRLLAQRMSEQLGAAPQDFTPQAATLETVSGDRHR